MNERNFTDATFQWPRTAEPKAEGRSAAVAYVWSKDLTIQRIV